MSPKPFRLAAAAVLLTALVAHADMIEISGSDNSSSFSGSVTVNNVKVTDAKVGTGTADVIVKLTNSSKDATGGLLTGFAFNNPESKSGGDIDKVTGYSVSPNTFPYVLIGEVESGKNKGNVIGGSINGSPYGAFDLGAALGNDLLGGGGPGEGLAFGQTATFTFNVSGTIANLSAANILAALSTLPPGSTQANFLVRFKATGKDGEGSEKVLIDGETPVVPPGVVPAPPAVVLAGIGIASCFLGRLRRKAVVPVA